MPLRRSLFTVFSLTLFGMTAAVAQQNDPFAEWDRIHGRTNTKNRPAAQPVQSVEESAKRPGESAREKSKVTYFSPAVGADQVGKSAPPAHPAVVPMREKTATRLKVEQQRAEARLMASSKTVSGAAEDRPLNKESSEIPNEKRNKVSTVAYSPDALEESKRGGISNAAYSPGVKSNGPGEIRKLAAKPPVDEVNPFEEFLGAAPAATANAAETFEPQPEEEIAEPLFGRPVERNAPKAPVRPVTAPRAIEPEPVSPAEPDHKSADAESGPQSPGVTVQWVKHGGLNVGQECEVELVVRNSSQTVVRSVMAEADIPANVEVVETQPAAAEQSQMPTWTFGELQPGQSRSVKLKLIPKSSGEVQLAAYVRLTGSTSSRFTVEQPMIGVAVSGPERVEIGQQVGYLVRVTNPGTGVANSVIIQAAVPEGLEHRNGSLLNIEIGTLNPGESRQARLSLTAVKGGEQQLAVRVIADGGLSEQSVTAIEVAEPQLAIVLVGPNEAQAGRSDNYTLTVSNGGSVQSTNVRAKYVVPTGFSFVSADRGGKYVEIDNAVEWFVGTLQPDDKSDFSIVLKAVETGEFSHKAGVISEHGQVTTCELVSNVAGTAALDLKIAADKRERRVGEEIRWEVQIGNTGLREATNVGVSCELPTGFELIAADGPTKYIEENGVLVFRSIPAIDAASDVKLVIRGRCTREGNQSLRLRVASESVNEVLIGEGSASISR